MKKQKSISSAMQQSLGQAISHHQAGRLQEAERLYREILRVRPHHPDAQHNLGVLMVQTGQPTAGLPHFKAALEANPGQEQFWVSYIDALRQSGQTELAWQVLEQGRARGVRSHVVERASMCDNRGAGPTPADMNQVGVLFQQGAYPALESLARTLTARFPGHGFGWKVLGLALTQQKQDAEAAEVLQKALVLLPADAEIHGYLGTLHQQQGRFADAETCFRQAVALQPDSAEANYNLGLAIQQQERLDEAETCYRTALQLKPDYGEACCNLGYILMRKERLFEAEIVLRKALQIRANYGLAHTSLGYVLMSKDIFNEAENCLRRAQECDPASALPWDNLLFCFDYHPDKTMQEIYQACQEYDRLFGLPYRTQWRGYRNAREIGRRLRVGYVSPDFRKHSINCFVEPLLAHHDKRVVEVFAYAELAGEDAVTVRYQGHVDHWVPTVGMTDEQLSERVRADGIDILVDLGAHTKGNRLGVFARKPTPVSVTWLGGHTTGLSAIDYMLIDSASAPLGSDSFFLEKLWRLAMPAFVYRPATGMGMVSPLPALTNGFVRFGTLGRSMRMHYRVIRVWAEILKRVERSRLVIYSSNFRDSAMQQATAEKFVAHGIERDRLELGHRSPPWDILRSLDIGLDCFPVNSGTTMAETLYMGVPAISMAEREIRVGLGSEMLEVLGHSDWIARSEEEYVELAVSLAADLPRLATLRAGLRQKMEQSPLMDESGFARKVERAYREMWSAYCQSGGGSPGM